MVVIFLAASLSRFSKFLLRLDFLFIDMAFDLVLKKSFG